MNRFVALILLMVGPLLAGAVEPPDRLDVQHQATALPSHFASLSRAMYPTTLESEAVAGKRPGSRFTPKDKRTVKQDHAGRNEGKTRCEACGVATVPAEQHKKGVISPGNETHVDHVIPKAKGGTGDPETVRCCAATVTFRKAIRHGEVG